MTINDMLNISFNAEDPFGSIIREMVARDYPSQNQPNKSLLLDLIEGEVYGTKQFRYGPKPKPESQVAIRAVIRNAIERNEPIRFVAPWGSEKPDGSGPDLAELSALKMMVCLHQRVKGFWNPGVEINIRTEDASAGYLFAERSVEAQEQAQYYTNTLGRMIDALSIGANSGGPIRLVRETDFVNDVEFSKEAERYRVMMYDWLRWQEGITRDEEMVGATLVALTNQGWANAEQGLPSETRAFYYKQYEKLYPHASPEQKRMTLARYFASALARKKLHLSGVGETWGTNYLDLAFLSPIPGTENIFGRRIYYRTVPSCITSNHIAPWRAKGFAVVDGNGREAKVNLTSFGDLPADLNKFTLTLDRDGVGAQVVADYVVS